MKKKLDNKKLKVCILAAGAGSRNRYSENYHKGLLPINFKAIISHIIDYYPKNSEFIIAVNKKKSLIEAYLNIAKPDHNIKFVVIKKTTGNGSGPGKSLLECKKYLQSPFIFHSCDTLFEKKKITYPKFNWVGYDFVSNTKEFVTIHTNKKNTNFFVSYNKKSKAFIGIAGIREYKQFWSSLEKTNIYSNLINDIQKRYKSEKQTIDGFKFLEKDIKLKKFNWHDTGNDKTYINTKKYFEKAKKIPPIQKNEFLYFDNKKVIKYFKNKNLAKIKKNRSFSMKKYLPKNINYEKNFLYYDFVAGKVLMRIKDTFIFSNIIKKLFKNFWSSKKLNYDQKKIFRKECLKFYQKKTYQRIDQFLKKYKDLDNLEYINGLRIPRIESILKKVDWKFLSNGYPVNFHGDMAISNIIHSKKNKFYLIDWRDSFGKLTKFGDIYYDLGKLFHTLRISHIHLEKKYHHIKITKDKLKIKLETLKYLEKYEKIMSDEIKKYNFDLNKVKIISWLILLNSSALHTDKNSALIYFIFGKLFLFKELNKEKF